MLAKSNDNRLLRYEKIDNAHIFFYQRWREMLENRTLDMYQYNILNSYVACMELSDVIDKTMSGLFTSRQNIDDCKEETMIIVKSDEILEKHNYPLKALLLHVLGTKIGGKSRSESNEDKNGAQYISLNRLKYQLKTPIRQLGESYLMYIVDSLKDAIDSQDNYKTEKCISSLISQCVYNGWSARGLFQLSEYFTGSKTIEEKWEDFKSRIINNPYKSFAVFYSLKIETLPGLDAERIREIIRSLGLKIQTGSTIIEASSDKPDLCSKISHDATYVVIDVNATDIYAGVLSAINNLNSKLSIATFYNIISPWIANSPQIIVYDSIKNTAVNLKLTDIFKTYDYIDSHNRIFEYTNQIFGDPSKKEIATRIGAAFAYTSLSRSALFQETKFISLWIALESLMRTGQYNDIISHIKLVLPEIMCTRYVYRIMRNFSEDCIRCELLSDEDNSIDLQSPDKARLVEELISIFRDSTKYPLLYQKCSCNTLLQYRCNEIHSMLNSTEEVINKLDHYTQKIRWHIQRLYRIRNEITHSAFNQNKSLVIYIEHLYSYLAQIMSEIVFYIENKNVGSVEEALSYLKDNYITYCALLKEGSPAICSVLSKGIIELV